MVFHFRLLINVNSQGVWVRKKELTHTLLLVLEYSLLSVRNAHIILDIGFVLKFWKSDFMYILSLLLVPLYSASGHNQCTNISGPYLHRYFKFSTIIGRGVLQTLQSWNFCSETLVQNCKLCSVHCLYLSNLHCRFKLTFSGEEQEALKLLLQNAPSASKGCNEQAKDLALSLVMKVRKLYYSCCCKLHGIIALA